MTWAVSMSGRVAKRIRKLPDGVRCAVEQLVRELADAGPVRVQWPNYGRIKGRAGCHHCHIRKGRPTYVAVWKECEAHVIEVVYVGTHEGADYARLC